MKTSNRAVWIFLLVELAISCTAALGDTPFKPYTPSIFISNETTPALPPTGRPTSQTRENSTSDNSLFGPPSVNPWAAMLYGGIGTRSTLQDLLELNPLFDDSQFVGGAINREMFTFFHRHFSFELEGQVIRHIGIQNNWEFNGLYAVRFNTFPWDNYVDTSVAVGSGLSYATSDPVIEDEDQPGKATKLLHYLTLELAFGLPRYSNWSLATRIHHRSGVFGLFSDVKLGSNFIAAGLRYKF